MGALALVALLALAGCGSIAGGGTPEVVTPAPVPTMEPTPVPGVADGAIDAERLVARHARALAGTSFAMTSRYRARLPGGDAVYERETRLTRGPNAHFRYRQAEPTMDRRTVINRTDVWWDGDLSHYRYQYVSGSVDVIAFGQRPSIDLDRSAVYDQILSGLRVTRAQRRPGGDARVTGRLPNASAVPTAGGVDDPRNASATIHVREDGLIEAVAVGYEGVYRGNRTDVRFTVGFENVGSSTVEPPPWRVG